MSLNLLPDASSSSSSLRQSCCCVSKSLKVLPRIRVVVGGEGLTVFSGHTHGTRSWKWATKVGLCVRQITHPPTQSMCARGGIFWPARTWSYMIMLLLPRRKQNVSSVPHRGDKGRRNPPPSIDWRSSIEDVSLYVFLSVCVYLCTLKAS